MPGNVWSIYTPLTMFGSTLTVNYNVQVLFLMFSNQRYRYLHNVDKNDDKLRRLKFLLYLKIKRTWKREKMETKKVTFIIN